MLYVTDALRHRCFTSPMPYDTDDLRHRCFTSPMLYVTDALRHHYFTSPMLYVTDALRHQYFTSPMIYVTEALRHVQSKCLLNFQDQVSAIFLETFWNDSKSNVCKVNSVLCVHYKNNLFCDHENSHIVLLSSIN